MAFFWGRTGSNRRNGNRDGAVAHRRTCAERTGEESAHGENKMNETMKWNITKGFLGGILMLLEEDDRRGLLDHDEMMVELKELGAYSLTHADIIYSAKGLRLLSLAAFFGMPFAGNEFDFSR